MTLEDFSHFKRLIEATHQKALNVSLRSRNFTETDGNALSAAIKEQTGLFIGGKTILNYVNAVLKDDKNKINPNPASLDTLARYCLNAQYITDQQREKQGDFYWKKFCKLKDIKENSSPLFNRDYMRAMLYSGAFMGFISAMLTVIITFFNGYSGYPHKELLPLIFLVQVLLGGITGWFCGYVALKGNNVTIFQRILLFVISFLCFVLIRQIAVRDALVTVGSAPEGGGGPLGEPDFEMLGTAAAYAAGILSLAHFLIKNKVPLFRDSFKIAIQTSLIGGIVFAGIYLVFRILTANGILTNGDYIISPAFFKVSFPHPQRIFLVVLLGAIYIFSIINLLRWQVKK